MSLDILRSDSVPQNVENYCGLLRLSSFRILYNFLNTIFILNTLSLLLRALLVYEIFVYRCSRRSAFFNVQLCISLYLNIFMVNALNKSDIIIIIILLLLLYYYYFIIIIITSHIIVIASNLIPLNQEPISRSEQLPY